MNERDPTVYPYDTTKPIVDKTTPVDYTYWNDPYNVPPIPPPPPKEKPRIGRIVFIACFVLLLGLTATFMLLYVNTLTKPVVLVPAKLVTVVVTPRSQIQATPTPTRLVLVQPTPTYEAGLSSTNFTFFLHAFNDALANQDVESIEQHTDILHFSLGCTPIVQSASDCFHTWRQTKRLLEADQLELSTTPNFTPAPASCPGMPTTNNQHVTGGYDDKGANLPVAHFGTAVFTFVCVTCGSETTWAWQSVYLC